jgi:hypothetical protein
VCSYRNDDQLLLCVADGKPAVAHYETSSGLANSLPAWQDTPDIPIVDIACLSLAADHQEAFALDEAGSIWHSRSLPPTSWTPWALIDRTPGRVTAIAAGAHEDSGSPEGNSGLGVLLAATADGKVHQASCELDPARQSSWVGWSPLPPL